MTSMRDKPDVIVLVDHGIASVYVQKNSPLDVDLIDLDSDPDADMPDLTGYEDIES